MHSDLTSSTRAELQKALLEWYPQHKRSLPWREAADPYRVLLSEILLQQTRVDQALPYYRRFLDAFPTLQDLGRADLEAVLRVWQGVGYYARARNLHKLAQTVGDSALPRTPAALLGLPGLGPYTAAALASIAFGEPVAAVDGNVRRVLSRWMAWENPTAKQVQAKADDVLAKDAPGDWNQAMMELGATVCVPKNPRCSVCPVAQFCRGKTDPHRYPAPKQRTPKAAEAVALVLRGPDGVHLEQRTGKVLGGLWGVPMAEGEGALGQLLEKFGVRDAAFVGTVLHVFTHRRLTVKVYAADWDAQEQPDSRPLSRLDRKILELAESAQARLL